MLLEYTRGIIVGGHDAPSCAARGVCIVATVTAAVAPSLTPVGASSGSALGHPGGRADCASATTVDVAHLPLLSSSVTSTVTTTLYG